MAVPDFEVILSHLERRDVNTAVSKLERWTERFPTHPTTWIILAKVYETQGRWDDALKAWVEARFLLPNSPVVQEGKARALRKASPDGAKSQTPKLRDVVDETDLGLNESEGRKSRSSLSSKGPPQPHRTAPAGDNRSLISSSEPDEGARNGLRIGISQVTELLEGVRAAGQSLWSNLLRTILTTIGIVIGVLAVTSMGIIIDGIEQSFEQTLSSLGANVLRVQRQPAVRGPGYEWWKYADRPPIKEDVYRSIRERAQHAKAVTPVVGTSRRTSHRTQSVNEVSIQGATAQFSRVRSLQLDRGRFFSPMESRGGRNVVVISASLAEDLFSAGVALRRTFEIEGVPFRVIGVLKSQRGGAARAIIPYETFKQNFGLPESIIIDVSVRDTERLDEAEGELTGIVRTARGLDPTDSNNFKIVRQEQLREQLAPVKTTVYGVGLFLTALALLVGGIGVMNIMFVTVRERTKEIGIRKAVGAKRRTVLFQFLVEAVLICLLGGGIGLLGALGSEQLIATFLPGSLKAWHVLVALAGCISIGILFGLAPAWTAATSDPVEAIRYE